MSAFLPSVNKMLLLPSSDQPESIVVCTFRLLLYMAEHAWADFSLWFKMCGFGESEEEYIKMDGLMLDVIERLAAHDKDNQRDASAEIAAGTATLELPNSDKDARWDRSLHGDVGEFKTGRPNKQQRALLAKQKARWEKERINRRRERREKSQGMALLELGLRQLKDDRDEIKDYGLEGYSTNSIERLEELIGGA